MSSAEWLKFFQELNTFPRISRERNIFSLGGRGYYENPTSDILKFFLNPGEEHGFDFVLSSLVDCLEEELGGPLTLEEEPEREFVTDEGKKIDLVLNGSDWVIVVENKLRHDVVNPFDEYVASVKANDKFKNKRQHFVILAPYPPETIPGWKHVHYKKFVERVREKLGTRFVGFPISKWIVLLREFLMNIEDQIPSHMKDEEIDLVEKNYPKFIDAVGFHRSYLKHLLEEIGRSAEEHFGARPDREKGPLDWQENGHALQVYPWKDRKENVTLLVGLDGRFRIQYYVGRKSYEKNPDSFTGNNFLNGKLDGTIYCLLSREFQNNRKDALRIFEEACQLLKQAY